MEFLIHTVGSIVDYMGLTILLIGAIKFLGMYAVVEARRLVGHKCVEQLQTARRVLGSYILLALEFLIVSDILVSALSRSLESLGYLAGLVAIRTTIGFFLAKELTEIDISAESNG